MNLLFYPRITIALLLLSFIGGSGAHGQDQKSVLPSSSLELTRTETGLKIARAKENFSTLSLGGSDLIASPPLMGGTQTTPQFVRELLEVQWRPNDAIDLYVIRPAGVKNPPVVLYLYSYPSNTDRFKNDRYCQRLVQNGAAAVGFVAALDGQRYKYRPMKEWFVSELQESLVTTVHDVQLILNYLDSRGDLDMSRVGMFGQGSGAAIAIMAAATDSRIKAIDLLNPWGDWPDWYAKSPLIPKTERPDYLKTDFLKQLEPLEPAHFLPGLKTSAIRIQIVDDEVNATKESEAKIEAAAPPTAKTIHYPNGKAMYAASSDGRLFEWLASTLKSPKESSQASANAAPAASPLR